MGELAAELGWQAARVSRLEEAEARQRQTGDEREGQPLEGALQRLKKQQEEIEQLRRQQALLREDVAKALRHLSPQAASHQSTGSRTPLSPRSAEAHNSASKMQPLLSELREERGLVAQMLEGVKQEKLEVIAMMHAFELSRSSALQDLEGLVVAARDAGEVSHSDLGRSELLPQELLRTATYSCSAPAPAVGGGGVESTSVGGGMVGKAVAAIVEPRRGASKRHTPVPSQPLQVRQLPVNALAVTPGIEGGGTALGALPTQSSHPVLNAGSLGGTAVAVSTSTAGPLLAQRAASSASITAGASPGVGGQALGPAGVPAPASVTVLPPQRTASSSTWVLGSRGGGASIQAPITVEPSGGQATVPVSQWPLAGPLEESLLQNALEARRGQSPTRFVPVAGNAGAQPLSPVRRQQSSPCGRYPGAVATGTSYDAGMTGNNVIPAMRVAYSPAMTTRSAGPVELSVQQRLSAVYPAGRTIM
jgi:hypothetical protein